MRETAKYCLQMTILILFCAYAFVLPIPMWKIYSFFRKCHSVYFLWSFGIWSEKQKLAKTEFVEDKANTLFTKKKCETPFSFACKMFSTVKLSYLAWENIILALLLHLLINGPTFRRLSCLLYFRVWIRYVCIHFQVKITTLKAKLFSLAVNISDNKIIVKTLGLNPFIYEPVVRRWQVLFICWRGLEY